MAGELSQEAKDQLSVMMVELTKDPKHGSTVKRAIAEKFGTRFPDIESEDIKKEIDSRFEAKEQKEKAEQIKATSNAQRQALIDSGRFKEEDVSKMEKEIMEKKGIYDYNDAAIIYNANTKPAEPTHEIKSRTWDLPVPKMDDIGNIAQKTLNDAYSVVDELRGRRKAS